MPLPLPNLDNRRFDDLVEEMRAMIPQLAPDWTNHNISDPGITLVELLAWVAEANLYRANRIAPETLVNFISLLLGESSIQTDAFKAAMSGVTTADIELATRQVSAEIDQVFVRYAERDNHVSVLILVRAGATQATDIIVAARNRLEDLWLSGPKLIVESLDSAKQRALRFFAEPYRAITTADFAREALLASTEVGRVSVTSKPQHGTMEVAVVPVAGTEPDEQLLLAVKRRLDDRKLVGTRVLVGAPRYTDIDLKIRLVVQQNTLAEGIVTQTTAAVTGFFDPHIGGQDAVGWPFGRPISVYELYHIVESISGVDHVDAVVVNDESNVREVAIADLPKLTNIEIIVVNSI
jgi:hypothetical protein